MVSSSCWIVTCDWVNQSVGGRSGKCYLKDRNLLNRGLITKRRGIFRVKAQAGRLYSIGYREQKHHLLSPSSFSCFCFGLLQYVQQCGSEWHILESSRGAVVHHPLATRSHRARPSAPFHPFPRGGTSSRPVAPVGQAGLAAFSCSGMSCCFWGRLAMQTDLPKMQHLSLKGEFVGHIYFSSELQMESF